VVLTWWPSLVGWAWFEYWCGLSNNVQSTGFEGKDVRFAQLAQSFPERRASTKVGVTKHTGVLDIGIEGLFDQVSCDIILGLVADV